MSLFASFDAGGLGLAYLARYSIIGTRAVLVLVILGWLLCLNMEVWSAVRAYRSDDLFDHYIITAFINELCI